MKKYNFVAPCHFGIEAVLKREIQDLGYDIVKVEDGRDSVEGAIFTCHEISGFCIRFENSEVPEVHAFAKSV